MDRPAPAAPAPWAVPAAQVCILDGPENLLGEGPHGLVRRALWLCTPVATKAIKVLGTDAMSLPPLAGRPREEAAAASASRGIHRELDTLAGMRHPHLLQFLGALVDGGGASSHVIVTELADASLHAALHAPPRSPMTLAEVVRISAGIARGLQYLHEAKRVAHRDMSSRNVLLAGERVLIGDFGMAQILDSALVRVEEIGPSNVAYAAPEVFAGDIGCAVDIFAFGVLLLEMLTQALPAVIRRAADIVTARARNAHLTDLVVVCLSPVAADRPSAERVLEALEAVVVVDVDARTEGAPATALPALIRLPSYAADSEQQAAIAGVIEAATIDGSVVRWCKTDDAARVAIARAGGIPVVLRLVESRVADVQQNAAAALRDIAINDENKVGVASAGGISILLRAMGSPVVMVQKNATAALRELAINDDNKILIANAGGILAVIRLLQSPVVDVQNIAAGVMWYLSLSDENKVAIAAAQGIPALVRLVDCASMHVQENAVGALASLSVNAANMPTIWHLGGHALLRLARDSVSLGVRKWAAWALANICYHEAGAHDILGAGGFPTLLAVFHALEGDPDRKYVGTGLILLGGVLHGADRAAVLASGVAGVFESVAATHGDGAVCARAAKAMHDALQPGRRSVTAGDISYVRQPSLERAMSNAMPDDRTTR